MLEHILEGGNVEVILDEVTITNLKYIYETNDEFHYIVQARRQIRINSKKVAIKMTAKVFGTYISSIEAKVEGTFTWNELLIIKKEILKLKEDLRKLIFK